MCNSASLNGISPLTVVHKKPQEYQTTDVSGNRTVRGMEYGVRSVL